MADLSAPAEDLLRLDAIHGFLSSATAVLHLFAGLHGLPAGVLDLTPAAEAIEQDIANTDFEAELRRAMALSDCASFDLVIHHAPSNARSVVDALNIATRFLAPRGTFVAKVVMSQDFGSVKNCLSRLFESVEIEKLAADTYILGFEYKHWVKIDLPVLEDKLPRDSSDSSLVVADVSRRSGRKRFREEEELLEDREGALLLPGPSGKPFHGPLAFNPMPKTLKCLLSSSSLLQLCFPLPNLTFSRFLETSSLQPSTSSAIVSTFGPQQSRNSAASTFTHNRLEVLHCPGTNKSIVFFPTGENSDQVGFLILSVEKSGLVVRTNYNQDVFVAGCRLNHQILRISVNPVVDSAVVTSSSSGNSYATVGYLLASTMYSVHWYAITVKERGLDSVVPSLIHMGSKVFKSCGVVHACWNPYVHRQSLILLESGVLFLFDLKLCQGANSCNPYCKGTKLKVSWDYPSNSGDFKWLGCEFSWDYRTVIVARSDAVFVVDLEHGKCNVDCLMEIEKLNVQASALNDQFRALTKAGSDGFHFALVSDSKVFLCDVRQPSVPVLQWAHGLEKPCYVNVLRLCDLRSNSCDHTYKSASESGYCIILGSFWTSQFKLFCYGPSIASSGTIVPGRAQVGKSFHAWGCASNMLLSGNDCWCGDCLIKKEFEKASLPPWIDWQHKKELVLGFSIINKDLSELLSEPDEFGGFMLVRLMSSGKLESQRYSASWDRVEKIEESHEKSSKFEDYLMCFLLEEEYKFSKRYKYLQLDYLNGYLDHNLNAVLVSKLENPSTGSQAEESFTPEFHEVLCEKLNACGISQDRTSPAVSLIFRDITMPSSIHEVALRRLWADLPIEYLQFAFSYYSEFLMQLIDNKIASSEFLAVPDQPQLPPFILRNPSWRSNKWSQKVPRTDALVGPVVPLPILLALNESHNISPNSEASGKSSVEEEIGLRRDEVMQVARELTASESTSELGDKHAVSLADDREETWSESEKVKPFLLHQPAAFSCSVDDAEAQSVYKDEAFDTLISKAREKEHSSVGNTENPGLKLFDSLCPIQLKFDDSSATSFGVKELKAYKLLNKQFSQWQGNFDLYKEFCSERKL